MREPAVLEHLYASYLATRYPESGIEPPHACLIEYAVARALGAHDRELQARVDPRDLRAEVATDYEVNARMCKALPQCSEGWDAAERAKAPAAAAAAAPDPTPA